MPGNSQHFSSFSCFSSFNDFFTSGLLLACGAWLKSAYFSMSSSFNKRRGFSGEDPSVLTPPSAKTGRTPAEPDIPSTLAAETWWAWGLGMWKGLLDKASMKMGGLTLVGLGITGCIRLLMLRPRLAKNASASFWCCCLSISLCCVCLQDKKKELKQ